MRLESEILAFLHSEPRCSRKEDDKILLQGLLFKKQLHTWKEFSKGTVRVWKNKASSTSAGWLFRVGGRANWEGEEARTGSSEGTREGCVEVQGKSRA